MQAPSASELLAVWERARAESATIQALTLLEAASPGTSKQELAKLSVGRRDGRLLELRELLFGSRLIGLAACPNCKQQLEIEIESANIRVDQDRAAAGLLSTSSGEYSARFRLPNSDDLKELTECRDPQRDETTAISKLVSRCLVDLRRNGRRQKIESSPVLPPALIDAIAAEMELADPQANVQLPLDCVDCGHRWLSSLDIVSFLWKEIDHFATTLLREVAALALAFGWREADILAMSDQRRQLYLQMIGDAT